MLPQYCNRTTNFKHRNKDGWPVDWKCDQQGNQLYKTQPNGFNTVGGIYMTGVRKCNANVNEYTQQTNNDTNDGD